MPNKVLHYFSLKDRLQRLFMSSKIARWMTWHNDGRSLCKNGEMRHPADAPAWLYFDSRYLDFTVEKRNVKLGLASDGFNSFTNMSRRYSICHVMTVVYNLPLWMCMKQTYTMMSLLISGPTELENDIDVYMLPLIEELKDLWVNDVQTYDIFKK